MFDPMPARKLLVPAQTAAKTQEQLENLYAQRTTITALIKSLQDYERLHALRIAGQNHRPN